MHLELLVSIPRLSAPSCLPSSGQNKCYGNIFLHKIAVFTVKMANQYGNHRCLIEKNVPIAFIVPSRWWDGAESLGIETASCLCFLVSDSIQWGIVASTFVYFTQLSPSGVDFFGRNGRPTT